MKTRPVKLSLVFFASVSKISGHDYYFLEPGTGKVRKTRAPPKHDIKHEQSLIKNSKKVLLALSSAGFSSSFYTSSTAKFAFAFQIHFIYVSIALHAALHGAYIKPHWLKNSFNKTMSMIKTSFLSKVKYYLCTCMILEPTILKPQLSGIFKIRCLSDKCN